MPVPPKQVSGEHDLGEGERTLLRPKPQYHTAQNAGEGEQTLLKPTLILPAASNIEEGEQTLLRPSFTRERHTRRTWLSVGMLKPESAKVYAILDIRQDEQTVQRIAIQESTVIIGRADVTHGVAPDIDLAPCDPSKSVSRRHARIRLEDTAFYVEDLGSRNRTLVDEIMLTPHRPELIQNGDVVCFGSVKATFRMLGTSELPVPWAQ